MGSTVEMHQCGVRSQCVSYLPNILIPRRPCGFQGLGCSTAIDSVGPSTCSAWDVGVARALENVQQRTDVRWQPVLMTHSVVLISPKQQSLWPLRSTGQIFFSYAPWLGLCHWEAHTDFPNRKCDC